MERLLKDAEKLTGRKFDISNFADIVDAIHAIQVNMDIAGTTAKEASTTISGSWNMVKASWEDMLVAMADPKGNIKLATANLVNSGKTMLSNVLPTIKQAISGLGDFIEEVAPMIGEYLPELIADFLPKFLKAGAKLATGLWQGLKKAWKKINWGQLASGIRTSLGEMLGLKAEDASLLNIVKAAVWKVKDFVEHAADWGRVKLAEALGLDDSASWGSIVLEGIFNVNEALKKTGTWIKSGLSKWLGLDDSADWKAIVAAGARAINNLLYNPFTWARKGLSEYLELDDTASWEDIIVAGVGKINEAIENGLEVTKIGLASLLGLEDENGNLPDDISFDSIGIAIIDRLRKAINSATSTVVLSVKKLLGLDANANFSDIGRTLVNRIRTAVNGAGSFLRVSIASLLGIDKATDATWLEIAQAIIDGIGNALGVLGGLLSGAVNGITEWFKDQTNIDTIVTFFKTVIHNLFETLGNSAKELSDSGVTTKIGEFIADVLKNTITVLGETLYGLFFGWMDNVNASSDTFFEDIVSTGIGKILYSIGELVTTAFYKTFMEPLEPIFTDIKTGLTDIWNSLTGTIGSAIDSIKGFARDIYYAIVRFFGGDPEWHDHVTKARGVMRGFDEAYKNGVLDQYVREMFGDNEAAMKAAEYYKNVMDGMFEDIKNDERLKGYAIETFTDMVEAMEAAGMDPQVIDKMFINIFKDMSDEEFAAKMDFSESALASVKEAEKNTQAFLDKTAVEGHINWTSTAGSGNRVSFADFLLDGITQAMYPHAKGAWNIPYNNYPASLHRGEMVLTASQARRYRDGEGGGSADVVSAIQSLRQDMQNLQLVVGERVFGSATVQYGGKKMDGYIGKSERKKAAGYGWG